MRLQINPNHPEPRKILRAIEALRAGEVIAYPTDTVYGLGADITQKRAVDKLYQIKGMDRSHPIAFICPDLSDIARYAVIDKPVYRILRRALPGPFTFILPATREVPRLLMIKRRTVGIRVPGHAVPRALAAALGNPLASTSAMVGEETLIDPADIDAHFRGLALILDAGIGGMEPSTVIDLSVPEHAVQRRGAGDPETLV